MGLSIKVAKKKAKAVVEDPVLDPTTKKFSTLGKTKLKHSTIFKGYFIANEKMVKTA